MSLPEYNFTNLGFVWSSQTLQSAMDNLKVLAWMEKEGYSNLLESPKHQAAHLKM